LLKFIQREPVVFDVPLGTYAQKNERLKQPVRGLAAPSWPVQRASGHVLTKKELEKHHV